jgi:hypothetical protein
LLDALGPRPTAAEICEADRQAAAEMNIAGARDPRLVALEAIACEPGDETGEVHPRHLGRSAAEIDRYHIS